jgi:HAD superfamily hydrolase (TIGR01509 family)
VPITAAAHAHAARSHPFTAILFDLDGVIVDSEPRHVAAFEEIFAELLAGRPHGLDLPSYIGRSDEAVWLDFIARHQPRQSLAELTRWKQDHYLRILHRDQPIFPEIPPLVRALSRHYRLAVASGSLHRIIEEVLSLQELRTHIPVVASIEDVGKAKPAPDVFLRAADLLKVHPTDCCVIEDSAAGVAAGRAAGMHVIAITNTLPADRLRDAHQVVTTYREIEALLLP